MLHRLTALTVTTLVTGAMLTVSPSASAVGETCQSLPATIVGTGQDIVGTPGNDVIVSGTSTNVSAGDGDDVICITSPDAVRVDAGLGDDTILSNGTSHEVVTGVGRDEVIIDVTSMPTGALGSYEGEDGLRRADLLVVQSAELDLEVALDGSVLIDGERAATVTGFRHAQVAAPSVVLRGSAIKNALSAHGCVIRISGLGGKDTLDTALNFEEPAFACDRADRSVRLSGGNGNDELFGGPGEVILSGGRGNDQLFGDDGGDALVGGGGNDRLFGGDGNDVLVGGPGRDVVDGEGGRDRCDAEVERRCER